MSPSIPQPVSPRSLVQRAGNPDAAVSVNYATSNGTAVAGIDYLAASGTLTFLAGQVQQSFSITILPNTSQTASTTTVFMSLSQPTGGATLGSIADGGPDDRRATGPAADSPRLDRARSELRTTHRDRPGDHGRHAHLQQGAQSRRGRRIWAIMAITFFRTTLVIRSVAPTRLSARSSTIPSPIRSRSIPARLCP